MKPYLLSRIFAVALALLVAVPLVAHADDAWLGVTLQSLDDALREALDLDDREGVLIADVERDSPADEAGLEDGDVILEIAGRAATGTRRVTREIIRRDPGDEIEIVVLRDDERLTITAVLDERDDRRVFRSHRPRAPRAPRAPRPPSVVVPDIPGFPESEHLFSFFSRPRLGVETRRLDDDLAPYFGVGAGDGVLVLEVMEDTPAEDAGMRAGDVILRVDEEVVRSPGELRDLLLDFEGEAVTIDIHRRGEDIALDVELDEPGRSFHRGHNSVFQVPGLGHDEELREELEELREELEELRRELGAR